MKTETSIGEPRSQVVRCMELRSILMNKETSPKPAIGNMEN